MLKNCWKHVLSLFRAGLSKQRDKLTRVCLTEELVSTIMQNEAGEVVDVYIPRKCSASGRIIGARDYASIQLNIADVDDKTGRVTGGFKTYAISGFIRAMGESDDCLNRLAIRDGIMTGEQQQN